MQTLWFAIFVSSICLEGLGRKYLPGVPSAVFYFMKDAVLLVGYFFFRPPTAVTRVARHLYRGFGVAWIAGFIWTIAELFNSEQQSLTLGIIGLRSYWLWWTVPVLIAGTLQRSTQKRRAIYILVFIAAGISVLAALQFASPPDSAMNLYSVVDGEEVSAGGSGAIIPITGRARVSSTFSYISGFSDFAILVPTLLLSLGLETQDRRLRRFALFATVVSAAVVPMSGSRSSIILGIAVLTITAWTAGFLFTRIGRRIVIGAIAVTIVALVAFPDAFFGVQSRFSDTDETSSRIEQAAVFLPPVALYLFDYPVLGLGTGMQQGGNLRQLLHVYPKYEVELETGKYLVELGAIGYLLIWTAKFGLIVALLRSYSILKRAGRRGSAGAALSYAVLTLNGTLTFDHIWQALYFTGCGIILAEVVAAVRRDPVMPANRSSAMLRLQAETVTPVAFQAPLGTSQPEVNGRSTAK
jgi:hypothetical protein